MACIFRWFQWSFLFDYRLSNFQQIVWLDLLHNHSPPLVVFFYYPVLEDTGPEPIPISYPWFLYQLLIVFLSIFCQVSLTDSLQSKWPYFKNNLNISLTITEHWITFANGFSDAHASCVLCLSLRRKTGAKRLLRQSSNQVIKNTSFYFGCSSGTRDVLSRTSSE